MAKKPNQVPNRFDYRVTVIRALSGGKWAEGGTFNRSSKQDAYTTADAMQADFDDDCDPCRVYVYRGKDPAPIYAGLAIRREY